MAIMPPAGPAQYLARFKNQSVSCNPYALAKLGVDRAHCSIKIEEYVILCVPFQLGFSRSIFIASLSKQELGFFQRYVNTTIGLSISLNPDSRPKPTTFFIRSTLSTIGQMKGRENVGLFVLDFKNTPDEMITILGRFMEHQERVRTQFEDYGKTPIRMTPATAKLMGYNLYAAACENDNSQRRIQIYNISSKSIEYLQAAGATAKPVGASITYLLFFKKYRVSVTGTITETAVLPQGIVRTSSSLSFSPELVEIIDDYWYNSRASNLHQHL